MFTDAPLEVVAQCGWSIHWGGIGQAGGIDGKLTACRAGPVFFYVRENLARNHFATSSGQRMAMKRGEKAGGVEVLELCAPPADWVRLAELVTRADGLGRAVRANRNFTYEWASRQFARRPGQGHD